MPSRDEQPGYVRVVSDLGTQHALQCFIYERDLDPGQATTRFFQAASSGIRFLDVHLISVEVQGGEPLLFLRAPYEGSMGESPSAGLIKFAIAPRQNFPVVCVHDEPGHEQLFERAVRQTLATMALSSPPENVPDEYEIWKIVEAGSVAGVQRARAWRRAGQAEYLNVGSRFSFEEGRLVTHDLARFELSDERGLLRQMFVVLEGARRETSVSVQREEASEVSQRTGEDKGGAPPTIQEVRYRFDGHVRENPVEGTFGVPRPLAGHFRHRAWLESDSREADLHLWSYDPLIAVDAARQLRFRFQGDHIDLLADSGEVRARTELGEDGLPREMKVLQSPGAGYVELLHRSRVTPLGE
jgi:hypothetical protein